MGTWGHGVFDSDDALDTVGTIFEKIGLNTDNNGDRIIPLTNNTILGSEWNPAGGKLHKIVVQQIFDNFKDIEKGFVEYDGTTYRNKAAKAEQYLVLCGILHHHGFDIPDKSAKKAYKAISYLLKPKCEETNDYDNPTARRNAINRVLNKIESQLKEIVDIKFDGDIEQEKVTVITKNQKKNNLK